MIWYTFITASWDAQHKWRFYIVMLYDYSNVHEVYIKSPYSHIFCSLPAHFSLTILMTAKTESFGVFAKPQSPSCLHMLQAPFLQNTTQTWTFAYVLGPPFTKQNSSINFCICFEPLFAKQNSSMNFCICFKPPSCKTEQKVWIFAYALSPLFSKQNSSMNNCISLELPFC